METTSDARVELWEQRQAVHQQRVRRENREVLKNFLLVLALVALTVTAVMVFASLGGGGSFRL